MLSLGALAFASPWLLLGLAVLPVLWWLLRVTPPAPRLVRFPALRLLFGLTPREETPARTPLWLILLRMALIAIVVLALAQPLLNPNARIVGTGPVVIAVDNGWSAARHWDARRTALDRLIDQAEREGRRVVLLPTAPPPGDTAAAVPSLLRTSDARGEADKLAPMPWPADRKAALNRLGKLGLEAAAEVIWLSDGIDDGDGTDFAKGLQRLGHLRVFTTNIDELPRLIAPGDPDDKDLTATVRRADAGAPERLVVRAVGDDSRLLARQEVSMGQGVDRTVAHLAMPSELRNRAAAIQIEGEPSAGAVLLLDERWRRRPVGVVAGQRGTTAQPLLSGAFYLERALSPFSEVRRGDIATLLKGDIAVLALPDVPLNGAEEKTAVVSWMEAGGVVLRFAGPHLVEQPEDDLLPVTIRRGGRTLGGALSWERPAKLARFAADSPFAGIDIPDDVTVSRQVLAEPTVDLGAKTLARLTDGTPLVTAEKRGKGWLVLVHTTADPEWSNLAISGLFVNMLRRVVALSQGVSSSNEAAQPPVETLDGFGRLQRAPATAQTIAAGAFAETIASPSHPPGFYGTADARRALNLAGAVKHFSTLAALPPGAVQESYARSNEVDVQPWLLGAAMALALLDLLIAFALRGLLPRPRRATAVGLALLATVAIGSARAQTNDNFAIQATSELHLAYVRTGVAEVDAESRAGLAGLSDVLSHRTAVETAAPMEINLESDELIFFPLLYWPVVEGQQLPSGKAIERVNRYLATGGTILFDTRDQGERTAFSSAATQARLRRLAAGLNLPPLVPVPPDHVLTKSFYLMQDFPGRWSGGALWIEPVEDQVNDGVASIIVGSNDWAGAWAIDQRGQPMYPAVPGGEPQREMAYRFGVNLVMYALTGNYKSDQVHVPAILERLGQ